MVRNMSFLELVSQMYPWSYLYSLQVFVFICLVGFGILRAEWLQIYSALLHEYCEKEREMHEGLMTSARDAEIKRDFHDNIWKNVVFDLLPQDIGLESRKYFLEDVDDGNKDIFSLSTSSGEETLIQVNYFKLAIAN